MTIAQAIHDVGQWLEETVCPNIRLKMPVNESQTNAYDYKLVNPNVWLMYAPAGKKMLPPEVQSVHPGIIVQVVSGIDQPRQHNREIKFRLHLCVWDPGLHGEDKIKQVSEFTFKRGEGGTFELNGDGWNDTWNLLDLVVNRLRNAEQIGDCLKVAAERGIEFGPYEEQGAIINFYPKFYSWVDFTVIQPTPRTNKFIDLL